MAKPIREYEKTTTDPSDTYDRIYQEETADIRFYVRQASRIDGAVLDLGCATGRISIPIAKKDKTVCGLDISPSMLHMAQEKAAQEGLEIQWVESDFTNFNLKQKFGLILMTGCTFQDLQSIKAVESCLERIKSHMRDDSLFIFDIYNPSLAILCRDEDIRYPVVSYMDAQNRHVTVEETNTYDRENQVNHITWYYSRDNEPDYKVDFLKMRQFFPKEISYILDMNGFDIEDLMGDFDGSKFTSDSNRQIFVLKLKKETE